MGSEYLERGLAGLDRHHGIPLQLIPLQVLAGAEGGDISAPCQEADGNSSSLASPHLVTWPRKPSTDALRLGGRLLMFLEEL